MRAIIATPPEEDSARISDIPRPEPRRGEVLLKTLEIGVDGTDREIHEGVYGTPPEGYHYLVLGHEALTEVTELGPGVDSPEERELVVPTVRRPDDCINCRSSESDMCRRGDYREHGIKGLHGFASDFCVSDSRFLVRVPRELRDIAVLLEPLSIGEKAIEQILSIQSRMTWSPRTAFVIGAGPLGLLTAMVLRIRNIEVKVAATRSAESSKARIVEEMGGQYVNVREDPLQSMSERFDLIVEATGNVNPAIDATRMLERNGVLCFMGNYRNQGCLEDFQEVLYEMVLGNRLMFGSVNSNLGHFGAGIEDMHRIRGRYPGVLKKLITRRIRPESYLEAFQVDRDEIKTVIEF
jgi:threonine dehydrogenase-like Zn-dependent dehydrogenase